MENKTETELLRLLSDRLKSTPGCSEVQVTRLVAERNGDWRFAIPPAADVVCRAAIIREEAAFRRRYTLAPTESGSGNESGAPSGVTMQGAVEEGEADPLRPSVSAKDEVGSFVRSASTFSAGAFGGDNLDGAPTAFGDRHRQEAAIAAASSGVTEPLSPLPAGNVTISRPPEAAAGLGTGHFHLSSSVEDRQADRVASVVVTSFTRNRDVISISVATFISLLDIRVEQLAEALREKNDPDAVAEVERELSEIQVLRQLALRVQQAAVHFEEETAKQATAVATSVSFADGIRKWWTERHVSICDTSFKTSLFLSATSVSYALGIPLLGAGICGVLVGGEPVAKVISALFNKSTN